MSVQINLTTVLAAELAAGTKRRIRDCGLLATSDGYEYVPAGAYVTAVYSGLWAVVQRPEHGGPLGEWSRRLGELIPNAWKGDTASRGGVSYQMLQEVLASEPALLEALSFARRHVHAALDELSQELAEEAERGREEDRRHERERRLLAMGLGTYYKR